MLPRRSHSTTSKRPSNRSSISKSARTYNAHKHRTSPSYLLILPDTIVVLKRYMPGLTAMLTAKPTDNSKQSRTLADNNTRKQARGGHQQTPANKPRRVPPSAFLVSRHPPMPFTRSPSQSNVHPHPRKSTVVRRFCCQQKT